MLPVHLALVSEVRSHDPGDVARVAAALQRQATRDFGPIWNVQATVNAFPHLEDVPVSYGPTIVETDIDTPGADVHEDEDGQPSALIAMSPREFTDRKAREESKRRRCRSDGGA